MDLIPVSYFNFMNKGNIIFMNYFIAILVLQKCNIKQYIKAQYIKHVILENE